MKIKVFLIAFTVIASVSASGVQAQNRHAAAIRQIDAFARSVDSITDRRKEPDLVFADTAADC